MHNLVHDVDEIRKFHSFLYPLKSGEAYFLSMSARDKYLSAEERKEFSLGRSEMFARKIVKSSDFETFLRVIRSLEVNHGGYTTRNNKNIPDKCLLMYANINASSGMKALKEFNQKSNELMFEMLANPDALKHFAALDSMLMNCYQRQTGTKYLLDVDFDVVKNDIGYSLLNTFIDELKEHNVSYKVIETFGGFHVLIIRETVKFNYQIVLNELNFVAKRQFTKSEIVKNVNDMVPVPGTLQAGFPVHFLEM